MPYNIIDSELYNDDLEKMKIQLNTTGPLKKIAAYNRLGVLYAFKGNHEAMDQLNGKIEISKISKENLDTFYFAYRFVNNTATFASVRLDQVRLMEYFLKYPEGGFIGSIRKSNFYNESFRKYLKDILMPVIQ